MREALLTGIVATLLVTAACTTSGKNKEDAAVPDDWIEFSQQLNAALRKDHNMIRPCPPQQTPWCTFEIDAGVCHCVDAVPTPRRIQAWSLYLARLA